MFYKLLLSFLLLVSSLCGRAQETLKSGIDVRIGIGFYSHPFFKEAKFNDLSPFEFLLIWGKRGIEGTGVFNVSATIDINDKMETGLSFLYQRIYVNYSVYHVEYRLDHLALLPHLNYRYFRRNNRSLYSGLAVGPAILHGNSQFHGNDVKKLAYQATFFGLRSGRKYASVIELGYGYKGIVNWIFSVKL